MGLKCWRAKVDSPVPGGPISAQSRSAERVRAVMVPSGGEAGGLGMKPWPPGCRVGQAATADAASRRTPRSASRTYGLSRAWCWAATVSSAARRRA